MSNFVRFRMDRERTFLARKQIQLAMVTILMVAAMVLVMLFNVLFPG